MSYLAEYLKALEPLLADPSVIEIAVNADGRTWIERSGAVHMSEAPLPRWSPSALRDLAGQIANTSREKLTDMSPIVSTALAHAGVDLRVQAMIEPAVLDGTALAIRIFRGRDRAESLKSFRFLRDPGTSLEEERQAKFAAALESVEAGDVDALLKLAVTERMNIIVSGGTSTGKTELGRRLLSLVNPTERIVTIEDSAELLPSQPNVVSLIASRDATLNRTADLLLQASLRLRPDRIILGELRGAEAVTFLDVINTGHSGSFTTIHAETARKAMERLALLVLATGTRLSFDDVLRYLANSIDVIIQMGRVGEKRGVMEVWRPGIGALRLIRRGTPVAKRC